MLAYVAHLEGFEIKGDKIKSKIVLSNSAIKVGKLRTIEYSSTYYFPDVGDRGV